MSTLHRCFRLVNSMRLHAIALPVVTVLAPFVGLNRVAASTPLIIHPRATQMMAQQHTVYIPYFTELNGMTSILTLNNNMTEMATATVTLFNAKGQALVLPPIDLAPELPARFNLAELAKRTDFDSGSVQITFNGPSMGVTSQVTVT